MAIEEFTGQLDQERQPQAAQVTGAPRVEEFTGELDKETTKNPLMGGLARILDIAGSGAEAIQRSSAGLRKGAEEALPESMRSKFLSDEAVRQRQEAFTSSARQMSKDIGYEPSTSLADLGDNPLKVVPFVIERVITSSPDMAGAALAFTPYVMTRANEILNDRLKNDGKTYDQATVGDVAAATAGAIGEATLERFATKRILPGGKAVSAPGKAAAEAAPATGIAAAAKRIGKEVGVQGGTESLEELASYGGETIGTKKGFQPGEAGERMLEAGIVGAGLGGGARGAREVYDYAKQPKIEELPPTAKIDPVEEIKPVEEINPIEETKPIEPISGKEPWKESRKPVEPTSETAGETPVETAPVEPVAEKPITIPSKKGKIEGVDEIYLDPSELKLSKDVPQFKEDANEKGVVEPLQGKEYDYIGTPPIQVWRRLDGSLEVISGRHRLDLAKRTGADRIPAQVFDEAKGFNADMAAIMDAELNIRDGKGKVTDYVNYFREAGNRFGLTQQDYKDRGLLDSEKGKRAYSITVQGSDDLIQSLRGQQVKEDTAYRIAEAVPNDPRLQALGLKLVNEKPLEQAINILKAAKTIEPKQTEGGGEFDLFGFDDSAMKLAEDMGKLALKKQRELSDDILAIKPAAKRADKAAKGGVKVENPEKVLAEAKRLEELRSRWDNWASDPELVDQIRRELAGEVVEPVAKEAPKKKEAPIVKYRKEAAKIEASLPKVADGYTRLYRGNRPGEVGKNPVFTNSLAGIALPFADAYKGPLSYVDVKTSDLDKYVSTGAVAEGSEFSLPESIAAKAKTVDRAAEAKPEYDGVDPGAYVEKKEAYRHRTTADVEWLTKRSDGTIIATSKTKKEAERWADMYRLSKESFFKKYPELEDKSKRAEEKHAEVTVESVKMRRGPDGTDYLVTLSDGRTAVIYKSPAESDGGLGAWHIDEAGYRVPGPSQTGHVTSVLGYTKDEAAAAVAKKLDELEKYKINKPKLNVLTAAFKKWFGNSVVKNSAGDPLIVYHGTAADISEFQPSIEGRLGAGIYFTPDADAASRFSERDEIRPGEDKARNVIPVYLKIENLLDEDNITGKQAKALLKAIPKTVDEVIALGYPADLANSVREQMQKELDNWRNELQEHGEFSSQMLSYTLQGGPISVLEKIYKKAGFDGITRFSRSLKGYDKGFKEYLVFRPDQIKSAIGSGYTEGAPDITASFELTPEEKQTPAEKKAAAEREAKEIADREAEFFKLTPRTPEQGAGNYLQQDMIGAMGLTEAEYKRGIDPKSTEPGEPLILRDVTMNEENTYNDDANRKVDEEIVDQYNNMDGVKKVEVKEDNIEDSLSRQAQAVEDYVNMASQGKVTAEEFMKSVREAAAKGDIAPDVLNSIEQIYKNYPSVLEGIRFEVLGSGKTTGKYRTAGHYQPLARMIRLFKDTSGVMNPATVRHEIAHTMEQMMTPEQKRMVIRAWKDALIRATRAETTDEGHIFFQNVSKFLHDPKFGTLKAVIKSMPNVSYYQYVNPSEYWAVNAEEILKSRTEGAKSLRNTIEKLHEGLKQSFGMSNFWVGNKVFDQILKGDRFTNRMLISYLTQTKLRNYLGEKAPLATWDSMGSSWLEDQKYKYVDKYIDLLRAKQDIERMTGGVSESADAYVKETLSHSRISTRIKDFMRDHVAKLADVMRENNISQQQLHEYRLALHAPEYNRVVGARNPSMGDNAASITTKEAENYIKALGEERVKQLEKASRELDLMTQSTRNLLLDGGQQDFETINAWQEMFKHYSPMYRKDLEYAGGKLGIGRGFQVQGGFSKAAMGSTKEVADISESIIRDHIRAIEKVERARVSQAVFAMALENPNPSYWMAIDPSAIKDPAKMRRNLEDMGLDPDLINNLMQQPKKGMIDPKTGLVGYVTSPVLLKSDNVLATRMDGRDVYVVFNNSDPRARRLVSAMKNMDLPDVEGLYRASAYVTRWFAMVNTQLNPIFGLWNFARDVQGAALNLSSTPLKGMEKEILKDSFVSVKDIYRAIRAERKTGEKATTPGSSNWYDMQESGGTTGFKAQFVKPQSEVKVLESAITDLNRGKPAKAVLWLKDLISDYNDTLENAVRLSVYKAALAKGMSKQEAANLAKNITVNFNRKGANSQIAGSLFAFFNASIQGTARLGQTLKGPMGKKIIFGGMMLGVVQAAMMALAGFEDDEPPEFVKEKNIIIPMALFGFDNKKYISFPMPLGFNVFPGAGRILTEAVIGVQRGDDVKKKFFDILSLLANSFNPLGSSGISLQTIMPTPLDPLAAISQNKDAFGRPIYKADRETNPQVGYERTRESTDAAWKNIAMFINYMTGGTADVKGKWSPTGDEVAFLAGQITGGVGREFGKIYGGAKDFLNGDEIPPYKIPLFGKLYGDAESKSAVKNRFYANVTSLAEAERTVKGMQKRGENVMEYRREHPESQLINVANRIENEITQLNKTRSKLIERGATMEQIKRIEDVKERKMRMLNERYTALRKL